MPDFTRLRYSVDAGVATIMFAKPERLNALDDTSLEELETAATRASADPGARAILISGQGRGFCAGADLKFLLERAMGGITEPLEALSKRGAARMHSAIAELRRTPKPVVAAVNGPAAGA